MGRHSMVGSFGEKYKRAAVMKGRRRFMGGEEPFDLDFIERFNERSGEWGGYKPNIALNRQFPFLLNGIWLSYEEALVVDDEYSYTLTPQSCVDCNARTLYPLQWQGNSLSMQTYFRNCQLEAINLSGVNKITSVAMGFYFATKLRVLLGLDLTYCTDYGSSIFTGCSKFEHIEISNIKKDISFSYSSLLDKESLRYIVDHAANDEAITIKLHKNVLDKLQDETNTEWHAILLDAEKRSITFN